MRSPRGHRQGDPRSVGEIGQESHLAGLRRAHLDPRRTFLPQRGGRGILLVGGHRHQEGAQPLQPRMSLTLPKNERSLSSRLGVGSVLASCSSSRRCSALSFVGTATRTVTCRSPRPREPRWGTPWPRTRKVAPLWLPSGTVTLAAPPPPRVGTSRVVPRAAWVRLIGTSQNRLVPSRRKKGCSWTRSTT